MLDMQSCIAFWGLIVEQSEERIGSMEDFMKYKLLPWLLLELERAINYFISINFV